MSISPEALDQLILKLRGVVPKEISEYGFKASNMFFREFESFKRPLLTHLADIAESSLLSDSMPEEITEEFLMGFLDGVLLMMTGIAEINLVPQDGEEQIDGDQ